MVVDLDPTEVNMLYFSLEERIQRMQCKGDPFDAAYIANLKKLQRKLSKEDS